ncbi:peptidylprolyl isomerase [Agrobacterium sp. SHOUNA12C]|nr:MULTISPECIES: peptidylprolyl isomerase [Rhizobium]MCJ9721672.1 peptidylprolyl isomerase [Agrobacterium sp. BETTINA12B]MCJ9759533.1 peptidylprolyl isomerase [Agrobacterium sp. SHOUNA12C]MDJ1632792.1 peptidylprolyl isomerase [Rhizobium rhizogenes]WEO67064.1 peptidylprolyl isomerase [Rhizobium rhizogenes]
MATFAMPSSDVAFAASEVKVVVNNSVITSGDIAKRINFLKLQHQKGDLNKLAQEQLVDETLKRAEISRVRMSVSTSDVDSAFGRFAASNKMSPQQLGQILDKMGVGVDHFKSYIAVSMSWPRVVNARFGSSGGNKLSNDDLVTRMTENKTKPVTTEYFLKQIVFVVPQAKRNAILNQRKSEAEASRAKFPGCDQAKVFAATMRDVSVQDLGRVLAPDLPEIWKPLLEQAKGNTTTPVVTDRGVEYVAICSQRQVNDDVAAAAVFRAEDIGKAGAQGISANDKKYMDELRSKAQILYR